MWGSRGAAQQSRRAPRVGCQCRWKEISSPPWVTSAHGVSGFRTPGREPPATGTMQRQAETRGQGRGPARPARPTTTLVGLPRTSAEKRPTQSASLAWDARVCRAQSSDGSRADILVSGPRRDPAPARSTCPAPEMDGWTRGARRIPTARPRSSPALSPPWLLLLLTMALKPTVSLRSDDNNFRFSSESLFSKASRPSTWRVIALLCLTR